MQNKFLLISAFLFIGFFSQAQVRIDTLYSGPNSFVSFDSSARVAGIGWTTPGYNDSGWPTPYNGSGAQNNNPQCAGPNHSAYGYVGQDTMIWSSPTTLAPDTACFRARINVPNCSTVISATIQGAADDYFVLYINDTYLGSDSPSGGLTFTLDSSQCASIFTTGLNILAGEVVNRNPSCGYFDIISFFTIDSTGCTNTGIKQVNETSMSVSPNPAINNISISMVDVNAPYAFSLYDILGNKVATQVSSSAKTNIDISSFTKGIYTLQVMNDNGKIYTKKVVKE